MNLSFEIEVDFLVLQKLKWSVLRREQIKWSCCLKNDFVRNERCAVKKIMFRTLVSLKLYWTAQ